MLILALPVAKGFHLQPCTSTLLVVGPALGRTRRSAGAAYRADKDLYFFTLPDVGSISSNVDRDGRLRSDSALIRHARVYLFAALVAAKELQLPVCPGPPPTIASERSGGP